MKKTFLSAVKAMCAGVMTLCMASLTFVSCYDDSDLQNKVKDMEGRLAIVEELAEALQGQVDAALYTLEFQVSSSNELQYSFDGGKTWQATGVTATAGVSVADVEDGDDTITFVFSDGSSFTIEKPIEVQFEIRSGQVYFAAAEQKTIKVLSSGIADLTVISQPSHWSADIDVDGNVKVTAPEEDDWDAADGGYVKVHACSEDGKCIVGRILVEYSTKCQLSLAAYNGQMNLKAASEWSCFYYGVSTPESFKSDVEALLAIVKDGDYAVLTKIKNSSYAFEDPESDTGFVEGYNGTVKLPLSEIYGSELELGKEYIVWAFLEALDSYTVDNVVVSYYTHNIVNVSVTEGEKSAFDVMVNVSVSGAESYHAYGIPQAYVETEEDLANYLEMMVESASMGDVLGASYTENYSGSAFEISGESLLEMAAPNSKVYVLVLPIDGRPEYTAEDVIVTEVTTAPLAAGGAVNATAEQVWYYNELQYLPPSYEPVMAEIPLNATDAPSVVLNASATGWKNVYTAWFSDEELAAFTDDAALVDAVVANTVYAMTPEDIELPTAHPNFESGYDAPNFVAFFVDETGKYGELAKVKCEIVDTPAGKQLKFTWADMNCPAALDFGVGVPGKFCLIYDMFAAYGENLPAEMRGMYEPYGSMTFDFAVFPTSKTSGKFEAYQESMLGERQSAVGTYSEWNGTTCVVNFETFMVENQTMTVSETPINVYFQQMGGGAL